MGVVRVSRRLLGDEEGPREGVTEDSISEETVALVLSVEFRIESVLTEEAVVIMALDGLQVDLDSLSIPRKIMEELRKVHTSFTLIEDEEEEGEDK